MVSWCFPPQTDCEWVNLRDFVIQFNTAYGKAYAKTECLDKDNSRKQPEVLLQAPGEKDIVIERKSVVWPTTYLRDHSYEHEFDRHMRKLLGNEFRDAAYQLTVREASLKGKKQREVAQYAAQIVEEILSRRTEAKSCGIGSREPIPWCFRPLASHELEYDEPRTGIRFTVIGKSSTAFDKGADSESIKAGYAGEFQRTLEKAAPKFAEYTDCLKLLLVQFFGDSSSILDEDIIEIIKSARLPKVIDQIWLALEDWVSESDYEIAWQRVI